LGLDYAMLALSVNWAAGIVPGEITMAEIEAVMAEGMDFLRQVLTLFLRLES
jgi:5'-methylthioinosine phosphorylase